MEFFGMVTASKEYKEFANKRNAIVDTLSNWSYDETLEACIKRRIDLKLSQNSVAKLLHVSTSTIRNIETKLVKSDATLLGYMYILQQYADYIERIDF